MTSELEELWRPVGDGVGEAEEPQKASSHPRAEGRNAGFSDEWPPSGKPLSPQPLELLVGAMPGLLILSSGETAPGRGTVARRGTPQRAGGRGCCARLPMSLSSLEGSAGSPGGPGSAHRAERASGGSAIFWGPFGSHVHEGAGRQLKGAHMEHPQVKSESVKGPPQEG